MSMWADPTSWTGTASIVVALLFAVTATAWAVPAPRQPRWVRRHLLAVTAAAGLTLVGIGMGAPGWVHTLVFMAAAVAAAESASLAAQHWAQRSDLAAAYAASYRNDR